MGNYFAFFESTPANLAADLRTQILNSTDWSRPNAGSLPNLVKATTTRGAQMAVQLDDASVSAVRMQLGVYRTHDGTTGVDKIVRYLNWRTTGGATSDPIHCVVSAGKEHLFFSVEGPRAGEANANSSSSGTPRQSFFIGDLVPYHAGDSQAAVVCASQVTSGTSYTRVHVSRNAANDASWVAARMLTLSYPVYNVGTAWLNTMRYSSGDSKWYLWPYVVVEDVAGIRGRLAKVFNAGYSMEGSDGDDPLPAVYSRVSYNSENYILVPPMRNAQSNLNYNPFGSVSSSTTDDSPVIAVPYA